MRRRPASRPFLGSFAPAARGKRPPSTAAGGGPLSLSRPYLGACDLRHRHLVAPQLACNPRSPRNNRARAGAGELVAVRVGPLRLMESHARKADGKALLPGRCARPGRSRHNRGRRRESKWPALQQREFWPHHLDSQPGDQRILTQPRRPARSAIRGEKAEPGSKRQNHEAAD